MIIQHIMEAIIMNINQSEYYKQEMMKLYGRRSAADIPPEPTPEPLPEEKEAPAEEQEEIDDTAYFPSNETENRNDTNDFNDRFPEPELTGLGNDTQLPDKDDNIPPKYVSEESMGSGIGYIIVNVRAGDESSPIEGATVLVTAIVDGNRLIVAEGLTNNSGTTDRFSVPAPDNSFSQSPDSSTRPYSLYDVSVTAAGFFNARSVDVPVFAGITSVQNFSMIPVPAMMRQNDETVTYFNQEPANGTGKN